MQVVLTVLIWAIIGLLIAHLAKQRGRDPFVWFFLGLAFGVFTLLALFLLPAKKDKEIGDVKEAAIQQPSFFSVLPSEFQSKQWFYLDENEHQIGPIGFSFLEQKWNQHLLSGSTYVWCEGMESWHQITELALFQNQS